MVDWDYFVYFRIVFSYGEVCLKDFNGRLLSTGAETLGM